MKRKLSRITVLAMAFLMMLSSAVSGAQLDNKTPQDRTPNPVSNEVKPNPQFDPNELVRVVVEMEDEPSIAEATRQGKKFKDLPKQAKDKMKADKLKGQAATKSKAKDKGVKLKEYESFTTIVNGFSADVSFKDIEALKEIPGVAEVSITNEYQRPEATPEMKYSKELVEAQSAWRDYGFKGEGMVIGIIDTGLDPSHRDMVLTDDSTGALTEAEVNEAAEAFNLPGTFRTAKVPYGYNYMDDNQEIRDIAPGASMHGMHVSGIAGANGDEENGGIKGIAPEAQLLALKVFGNDPEVQTTYGDIYIKAIDDAINLGADVLNMSLGSTAGFVSADSPEQEAIKRATENGIMMAISGGNSANFGNGWANPWAENPDIGVVGSPGIAYDSLQVASLENSYVELDAVNYTAGAEAGQAGYNVSGTVDPNTLEQKTFDLVYAGLGTPADFEGKDFTGKFALIQRGEFNFTAKTLNAQAAGAAGVFIYNNTDGTINMADDPAIEIPHLFMSKSDGDKLAASLTAGEQVQVTFAGEKITALNSEAGKMSSFTSWGTTPNLDFKPEITAPGGQILSTLENNQYGIMSGTSMSAPHVAGGSALVYQRIDGEFGLEGYDRMLRAKNIMMNTASPLIDKGAVNSAFAWDLPYSPRRQGAGVMQLNSALSTPAMVTNKETGEAKVALKEVGDQFGFDLELENFSNEEVTYDVTANIQTDLAAYGSLGWDADGLEAQALADAVITINGQETETVTLKAGQKRKVKVTVDVTNAKVVEPSITGNFEATVPVEDVFENGYFVEGFVTFTDPADTNPTLNVPYMGFKGDWNDPNIFDGTVYDEESFYGAAGAVYSSGGYYYLGYNPVDGSYTKENLAISPNGDGVQDQIIGIISLLRNAEQAEVRVLDEEGNALRTIRSEFDLRKHYYDSGLAPTYSLDPGRAWDGNINGQLAEDGDYIYEVRARLDETREWQSFQLPVQVDTVVPEVAASFNPEENTFTVQAVDNEGGSGVAYYMLVADGTALPDLYSAEQTELDLPEGASADAEYSVVAVDFAGNEVASEVTVGDDRVAPIVRLTEPETLSVYNTNELNFVGTVEEEGELAKLTIADQDIPFTYNEEAGVYEFDTTLTFEDGVKDFRVEAVDSSGNAFDFKRTIFVDSTGPELEIDGLSSKTYVKYKEANPVVDVTVKDNFDEIRFYLNGNELFFQQFEQPFEMRAFEKTFEDIELELAEGENVFVFEVSDVAGNKTAKTVELYKLKEGEKPPKGDKERVPNPGKGKGPGKPDNPGKGPQK